MQEFRRMISRGSRAKQNLSLGRTIVPQYETVKRLLEQNRLELEKFLYARMVGSSFFRNGPSLADRSDP